MGRQFLDEKLLNKLAKNSKTKLSAVRIRVSKTASRHGISSEAALVILAKKYGIGTAIYQRKLNQAKQTEIQGTLPTIFVPGARGSKGQKTGIRRNSVTPRARLRAAIEYLLADSELLERCQDLLMARKHFDRAINQATQVLEHRIRKKAHPATRMVGEALVNFAFKPDLTETVLQIESGEVDDQRGYTQILRGVVPAFRNKTHHHIINNFSREDALKVCGFIDVLLRTVDNSKKTN